MSIREDFDRWADAYSADVVRSKPQSATVMQYFSGDEQDALDRQLALTNAYGRSYGAAAARESATLAQRGLDELERFPREELTDTQRTSAALIEWFARRTISGGAFAEHRFVFDQFLGLHVGLVTFLTSLHPIRNERDAENYLARLALVAGLLDEGITEARTAAQAGIVPPRFILQRSIAQLDDMLSAPPNENALVTTFAQRIEDLKTLSSDRAAALVANAREEVRDRVIPALTRVHVLLAEQITAASDDAGAWCLPDGAAFYAHELATATGSSLSPREIHEIGLREVARIEAEMDATLTQLGYANGSVKDRVEQLNDALRYPDEPDPRDALLAEFTKIVRDAERRSESVFALRPKSPVVVKREPAFSEKTSAAHYTVPAPDGSQPGIFWVPLADLSSNVPWVGIGMKSTAYHEAIPGHHFQLAIQQETADLPHFRKHGAFGFDTAYTEGWALYSEQLCDENDWYADDLHGRLGFLQLQLFRARRLVVDTGIHELRWTREQAIDYGFTAAEIERYIVWPGQACSYMLGMLRILELRERAKSKLGAAFSIKAFHDLVLAGGMMPLAILENEVEAWSERLLAHEDAT